jgi:Eco57I restriction-modification methylase
MRTVASSQGRGARFRDSLHGLTKEWGTREEVTLYLDRCQVDTPTTVVDAVWRQVQRRRKAVGTVVDYGAGDGRFGSLGQFHSYVGYEIDVNRWGQADLPIGGKLVNQCAFAESAEDADVCIGNPPYVRNQDLPRGWRQRADDILRRRSGVGLSGLANAWQYFFLLSLVSTKRDGLVALVIPYEWVSRPSAATIREYIKANGWSVSVYRLKDETFPRVLTTSSITIVDKADRRGRWSYAEEIGSNRFRKLPSVTVAREGVVAYTPRTRSRPKFPFAKRGLSPGTQKVLLFTERERARLGLRIGNCAGG